MSSGVLENANYHFHKVISEVICNKIIKEMKIRSLQVKFHVFFFLNLQLNFS